MVEGLISEVHYYTYSTSKRIPIIGYTEPQEIHRMHQILLPQ